MKKDQFTASVFVGHESFPPAPGAVRRSKLTKFSRVLNPEITPRWGCNSMKGGPNGVIPVMGIFILISNNAFNEEKSHNNRNFQILNDLQSGFENADNFSRVQRCKLIMPLLALLESVGMTYLLLTAAIVRGHYEGITE